MRVTVVRTRINYMLYLRCTYRRSMVQALVAPIRSTNASLRPSGEGTANPWKSPRPRPGRHKADARRSPCRAKQTSLFRPEPKPRSRDWSGRGEPLRALAPRLPNRTTRRRAQPGPLRSRSNKSQANSIQPRRPKGRRVFLCRSMADMKRAVPIPSADDLPAAKAF